MALLALWWSLESINPSQFLSGLGGAWESGLGGARLSSISCQIAYFELALVAVQRRNLSLLLRAFGVLLKVHVVPYHHASPSFSLSWKKPIIEFFNEVGIQCYPDRGSKDRTATRVERPKTQAKHEPIRFKTRSCSFAFATRI